LTIFTCYILDIRWFFIFKLRYIFISNIKASFIIEFIIEVMISFVEAWMILILLHNWCSSKTWCASVNTSIHSIQSMRSYNWSFLLIKSNWRSIQWSITIHSASIFLIMIQITTSAALERKAHYLWLNTFWVFHYLNSWLDFLLQVIVMLFKLFVILYIFKTLCLKLTSHTYLISRLLSVLFWFITNDWLEIWNQILRLNW